MNGFGTIDKRDINVLISSIENKINYIRNDISQNVTSLKNQLNACNEELNRLKKLVIQVTDYNDTEYKKIENRINEFAKDIEDIKSKLNTIQYNEIAAGKCASGINEYPIYAKYAENDTNGNIIQEYYAAKFDLSNVSSTLSADYTEKIAESSSGGMSALSSVSAQLVDSIEKETQERQSKDEGLEMSINNESIDRIAKDNELEERIETEKNSREEAISEIQKGLKEEETRATGAEESIKNDLSVEINVRTNAITELENKIKEEETRAIKSEQELQTSIVNETDTRKQSISQLQEAITIEQKRAESAESNLQTSLSNETSRATEAENKLQTNLDTEIKRATGIESGLRTDLDYEITRAIEFETTIKTTQENIDNEVTRAKGVENALQNQIDTIEATQNVIDLVASYAALTEYDTTNVKDNDKIQVICDETSASQTTIYSWNNNTWNGIGMFGPYYTKSQVEEEITKAINTEKTERETAIEELNTNKQNNLTAGDGISINNDVISHSIKIIENNNEEDKVEGTTFTVYLKNNHYKIITFDKTITSIKFIIESTTNNVLQETGFEFTCPDESVLEQINFEVKDNPNKKIYTILPDSYTGLNIYQGTIVNYKCTIGEYEVEN